MQIQVVDMHTAGEPVRIIVSGFPALEGEDILAKRRDAAQKHDHLRRGLMLEPRGHAGMYGVIPVVSHHSDVVMGALFTHNEGYSTMCGHATIALGRWLVDSGIVAIDSAAAFKIELPCGIVNVSCRVKDGRVQETSFDSVDCFVMKQDVAVDVKEAGTVLVDIAYGGAFYAILPASRLGLDLMKTPTNRLIECATSITDTLRKTAEIKHPDSEDLSFLYGTIITDEAGPNDPTYNLCVFADGQVDRSPTGSGVSARLARDHARGYASTSSSPRLFYGPTGLGFSGKIVKEHLNDGRIVITTRVSGSSSFIGKAIFGFEDDDPLAFGFQLPKSFSEVPVKRSS